MELRRDKRRFIKSSTTQDIWAMHSKPGNAVFSKSSVKLFGHEGAHTTTQTAIDSDFPRHEQRAIGRHVIQSRCRKGAEAHLLRVIDKDR